LQELVTLKDMHDKIERMAPQDLSDPRNYRAEELQEQYQQRKPSQAMTRENELAKLTEREINGLRADLLHNAHSLKHGTPIDPKEIDALCDMALKAAALSAEGMVRVPLEPTDEMLAAADKALWTQLNSLKPSDRNDRPVCIAVYKAMLAAAQGGGRG
jgi:hypothetical protein